MELRVSRWIREEFENGRNYYALGGSIGQAAGAAFTAAVA